MTKHLFLAGAMAFGLMASPALAQDNWTVRPEWVRAHESFLASDALQGRGSATRDEAIAAAYVASQFEGYGLKPAPGMPGYLQAAKIIRYAANGPAALAIAGKPTVAPTVLVGAIDPISGTSAVFDGEDPAKMPRADIVFVTGGKGSPMALVRAARAAGVKLLIARETEMTQGMFKGMGGKPRLPAGLEGAPPASYAALATLPSADFDKAVAQAGAPVSFTLPVTREESTTTNAIGWLPGSDPKAGVILVTAHLDHLGVQPDGTIMHGANDDASGTTAVLELARAMAAAKKAKRGLLFVAYGSEEIGGYGSSYFGDHPPVPLDQIVANIEIEMIGAQDPKLPAGTMMMTGFERSTLGETLKAHGALVTADPYPEQRFFERSDNYSLAVRGVVAHTISGWAVTPNYHTAQDTLENLDIAFMTRAIQSLVAPLKSLANSNAKPEWKPGGRPEKK
ncbi:M28 family metallopeptidase [Sphingomonas sp. Sphisp140]|uniref:M28 family metallopeptidase n=1 Tax=unclassified Sphingomonas TaxID=196159 RepID=UPI0039AEAAE1